MNQPAWKNAWKFDNGSKKYARLNSGRESKYKLAETVAYIIDGNVKGVNSYNDYLTLTKRCLGDEITRIYQKLEKRFAPLPENNPALTTSGSVGSSNPDEPEDMSNYQTTSSTSESHSPSKSTDGLSEGSTDQETSETRQISSVPASQLKLSEI
jgi:hypothetical protein